MKPDPLKKSLCVIVAAAVTYIFSYVSIRVAKPECLNTNDGPIAAFTRLYYPLRYLEAEKPAWYWKTSDGWLVVKIEEINLSNSCLQFSWDGGEAWAIDSVELKDLNFRDSVRVHFQYELETFDDYRSRLLPRIDKIARHYGRKLV